MAQTDHVERRLAAIIPSRMLDVPVLLLQGPRSVGKSTLLRALAVRQSVEVIDLDDPAVRDIVLLDPAPIVSGQRPILIDEYQKAPEILDYIKSELNQSSRPGQFLLTGSTRFDALPAVAQSLTGRLHRLAVHPFAQAELEPQTGNLVANLMEDADDFQKRRSLSTTSRTDYGRRILRGGFPLALRAASESERSRWFEDYVQLSLRRDVLALRQLKRADRLPELFTRLAGRTGQILNLRKAADAVNLDANTAREYTSLLESLFLLHQLPAWGKTLTARSAKSPKIHMVDSGVAAYLMRISESRLRDSDPTVLSEFGHLLETFVVNEFLRHASWLDTPVLAGHWRTHDGHEVDLVLERHDGAILAVEVKSSARIRPDDFDSLKKLRDLVGDSAFTGVVMYLGAGAIRFSPELYALPVDALWS